MAEVSLYKICLKRVYGLVKAGTWNSCAVNPFLHFSSKIINDLMESSKPDIQMTSDVYLLLTSGSLTQLRIHSFGLLKETDSFLNVIRSNCLNSLRFLYWYSTDDKDIPVMQTLIRTCLNLKEFHSNKCVKFEVFLKCENLKVLIFHDLLRLRVLVEEPSILTVLPSLKNLKVVSISGLKSNAIAKVLMQCPQLLCLGTTDSLDALTEFHAGSMGNSETNYNTSYHFGLKKCVWGMRALEFVTVNPSFNQYKSEFPGKIRTAVSLCPFVEELMISVYHVNSIESLKNLKLLTRIKFFFRHCEDDFMKQFLALLEVIGPNLKYLSVDSQLPVPIDMVCEYCPSLNTLQINTCATINGSKVPPCDLSLKNLELKYIDQKALSFILSSCKSLMTLFVCDALCLDDDVLRQILRLNPLAKLEICSLFNSSLTKTGFGMLLEMAVSLRRVSFSPFKPVVSMIKNLITELNLTNVVCSDTLDLPYNVLNFVPPNYFFREIF